MVKGPYLDARGTRDTAPGWAAVSRHNSTQWKRNENLLREGGKSWRMRAAKRPGQAGVEWAGVRNRTGLQGPARMGQRVVVDHTFPGKFSVEFCGCIMFVYNWLFWGELKRH